MLIHVQRDIFTERSTTSRVLIDGTASMYMLELPLMDAQGRQNVRKTTCIPAGRYSLRLRHSPRNRLWVPEIVNVLGRSEIEIHIANTPAEILGCLAPGMSRGEDRVDQSKIAFDVLMQAMHEAIRNGEPAEIEIRGAA